MTTTSVSIPKAPCHVRIQFLARATEEAMRQQKGETARPSVAGEIDAAWSLMDWWMDESNLNVAQTRRARRASAPLLAAN